MNIPELRAVLEPRIESCDIAAWITAHLQTDAGLRRALKRWGIRNRELADFVDGRAMLDGHLILRLVKDTGVDLPKAIMQYNLAAARGGGPVAPDRLEPEPYEDRPVVTVDLLFASGCGQHYGPDSFTRDGFWLRAADNNANTFGVWTVERRTGTSVRVRTGVTVRAAVDVVMQFEPDLPDKDFIMRTREVHGSTYVDVVALRPGEGVGPLEIRPGRRLGFVRVGSSALVHIASSKARAVADRWTGKAAAPKDGGLMRGGHGSTVLRFTVKCQQCGKVHADFVPCGAPEPS